WRPPQQGDEAELEGERQPKAHLSNETPEHSSSSERNEPGEREATERQHDTFGLNKPVDLSRHGAERSQHGKLPRARRGLRAKSRAETQGPHDSCEHAERGQGTNEQIEMRHHRVLEHGQGKDTEHRQDRKSRRRNYS